jgi:hypothetical protein
MSRLVKLMQLEIEDKNIKNQYELLNILDDKAAGLLTISAIFLTFLSVWLGYIPINLFHLTLDLVFSAILISCLMLLQVIDLRWTKIGDTSQELERILLNRTRYYQQARIISKYSIVVAIFVSVVHLSGTLLTVLRACAGVCQWFFSDAVFGNIDYPGGREP